MKLLADLNVEELKNLMSQYGEAQYRAAQIFDNVQAGKEIDQMTNISAALKQKLSEDGYLSSGVSIAEHYVSAIDGTVKFLFALADGNVVEGVLMKYKYGNTLCLSTQVGCRMNCAFCASGLNGLVRNLSAGEMLGEVIAANCYAGGTLAKRQITNVVLMGSGEPLDNMENVVKFLRLLNDEKGLNISYRNVSLSTCGLVDRLEQFIAEDMPVTMTFSLHSPRDSVRSEIMPVNKKYSVASVIGAAKHYFEVTKRRVIFEYSLIKDVNDTAEDAALLVKLLRGFPCHVNLIVLNYVKERGLKGTPRNKAKDFADTLTKGGLSCTIRRTLGADIEGACGQLRAKFIAQNADEKKGS